jgi:hypothetical protein
MGSLAMTAASIGDRGASPDRERSTNHPDGPRIPTPVASSASAH